MDSDTLSSELADQLNLLFFKSKENTSFQIRKNVEVGLSRYAIFKIV